MEANFESVWSRVTGSGRPDREQVRLKRWIDTEAELRTLCAQLGRSAADADTRTAARELLRSTEGRLRELRAMSFFRMGQGDSPDRPARLERQDPRQVLRDCYSLVWELTQDYILGAEEGKPDFRALCSRLAASGERMAGRLWHLALRSV